MKTQTLLIIFAIIALGGALALYLYDKETLAVAWGLLVWATYEKITKEIVKKDFKKANIISYSAWKNTAE